jgi:hypothetical protein
MNSVGQLTTEERRVIHGHHRSALTLRLPLHVAA